MKQITLPHARIQVPALIAGCMRIADMPAAEVERHIAFCLEHGLKLFDHADIYGRGACEEKFGAAVKAMGIRREDYLVQSKCSIVPGVMYDLSKEHILRAVDVILTRLGCGYLDTLLLHRPDALVEPAEVAAAFSELHRSGKVRHFGVSNHKPMQIELLLRYVEQPIEFNQMQLSLPVSNMIANGMEVNMTTDGATDRDGSVLDYCRLRDITLQAWSPFQYGFFEGPFIGNTEKFADLNKELDRLAERYGVTPTGIATAWMTRHPAHMQTIVGSTNPARLREILAGAEITLTREEWYSLYLKAGHPLP